MNIDGRETENKYLIQQVADYYRIISLNSSRLGREKAVKGWCYFMWKYVISHLKLSNWK